MVQLGCVCLVDTSLVQGETDTFELEQLKFKTVAQFKYLEEGSLHHVYFYHHRTGNKAMFGVFFNHNKKANIFVLDTVRSNQMPNVRNLFNAERNAKIESGADQSDLPGADFEFDIKFETEAKKIHRQIQRVLQSYRDEKKGPTLVVVQSPLGIQTLTSQMPDLGEFPQVPIHATDPDMMYNVLDWQYKGVKAMVRHFLGLKQILATSMEQCRYFHIPVGNLPRDATAFGADLFYARHLQKHNVVLWASPQHIPDLGGHEHDDNRLLMGSEEMIATSQLNHPNCYSTVCVELDIDALAVTSILQVRCWFLCG